MKTHYYRPQVIGVALLPPVCGLQCIAIGCPSTWGVERISSAVSSVQMKKFDMSRCWYGWRCAGVSLSEWSNGENEEEHHLSQQHQPQTRCPFPRYRVYDVLRETGKKWTTLDEPSNKPSISREEAFYYFLDSSRNFLAFESALLSCRFINCSVGSGRVIPFSFLVLTNARRIPP